VSRKRLIAAASVLVGLVATSLPAVAYAGGGTTFFVNKTGDKGDPNLNDIVCDIDLGQNGDQCTLRAAIQQANFADGPDVIDFNIPGTGVKTIAPVTALPQITEQVAIDGYSQPGTRANTTAVGKQIDAINLIELSGASSPQPVDIDGLIVAAGVSGVIIRGLVINRFVRGILVNGQAKIEGSFIGTDPSGFEARPNISEGVLVESPGTTVGGTTAGRRNLISANGSSGVASDSDMTVQGNYLGTARDGHSPLGNTIAGVAMFGSDGLIGGSGGKNIIAHNTRGVVIGGIATRNKIQKNSIFANELLGIDLGGNGVTPNDNLDADTGANGFQNFPNVTDAYTTTEYTSIQGVLKSTPNTTFQVELYVNPSGESEGKKFVKGFAATTNADGKAFFQYAVAPIAAGKRVTATATAPDGSTSEFSAPKTIITAS
jgi:CSLREA domain-containing protein